MMILSVIFLILLYNDNSLAYNCNVPASIQREIANYNTTVNAIFKYVLNGPYKHQTWENLARFVDKFGSRIAGSQNLEHAIDYMVDTLKSKGLENVHKESAPVPHWVR